MPLSLFIIGPDSRPMTYATRADQYTLAVGVGQS